MEISQDSVRAYYRAALAGLQAVESRRATGRRFGPDADARWKSFRGGLSTVDRMNVLIRDADTEWRGAFGARAAFGLDGVAEDDAFGGSWPGIEARVAEELWRESVPSEGIRLTLERMAEAWGFELKPVAVDPVAPADKLLVAGPSAIAALIEAFSMGDGLDWSDQVVVISTPPAHRQVGAIATALLNINRRAQLFTHYEGASWSRPRRLVISNDADSADAALAQQGSSA